MHVNITVQHYRYYSKRLNCLLKKWLLRGVNKDFGGVRQGNSCCF